MRSSGPSGWGAGRTNQADALARNDGFQHSLNLTQNLYARGYAFRSQNRRSGSVPLFALACGAQCIFEDPRPILTRASVIPFSNIRYNRTSGSV